MALPPNPLLVILGLLLTGCVGAIGDAGATDDGDGPGPGGVLTPSERSEAQPTRLRRITHTEYENSVRDLLGVDVDTKERWTPDEKLGAFSVNLHTTVDEVLGESLIEAGAFVAAEAAADPSAFLPCDLADVDEGCIDALLTDVVPRAFRRPIDDTLRAQLMDVFRWGRDHYDPQTGLETLIVAILQAPEFLYHLEIEGEEIDTRTILLSPFEIAARLSFFLWQSVPDAQLIEAAEAGLLHDPAEVEFQARRMLDDPRGEAAFVDFHRQWLGVEDLEGVSKSAELFPDFDEALAASMATETDEFVRYVLRERDGSIEALLTEPVSFVDGRLAAHYGLEAPTSGMELRDTPDRVGILSRASWLSMQAHVNKTSPTFRGLWVRENILCRDLPDPPPNIVPPEIVPGESTRQRSERIMQEETCNNCHQLMDLTGFAFESYDAIGAFRELDGDVPVDTSGELVAAGDVSGTFEDAAGLAERLAGSNDVKRCMTLSWFSFALGRLDEEGDRPSVGHALSAFDASDWDLRELIVAITQTDAFYYRAPSAPEEHP